LYFFLEHLFCIFFKFTLPFLQNFIQNKILATCLLVTILSCYHPQTFYSLISFVYSFIKTDNCLQVYLDVILCHMCNKSANDLWPTTLRISLTAFPSPVREESAALVQMLSIPASDRAGRSIKRNTRRRQRRTRTTTRLFRFAPNRRCKV